MISRVDQCNSIGTFSGHTAIQTKRDMQTFLGSTDLCGFRGRIINMSMFNDIGHRKPGKEQTCLENAKEVTEYATQFQLGHWCFCGLGHERVW